MNKKLLLLLLVLLGFQGNAQNILTNGDFEDFFNGWGTIKSVDIFGTPLGNLGTMSAQNGSGFCGLRFYSTDPNSPNWQEYIWQYIYGSMTDSAVYKVSIYHCLADMCTRTTDDFGVAFISHPYYFSGANAGGPWLSSMTPQIKLEDGDFPTNDISWTELTGYYQAHGEEVYAVVGSFKDDNTLDTIGIPSDHSFTQGDVYFFIDNFRIIECIDYPQIELEDEIVLCEEGEISLNAYFPGASYLWSTGDTTSSVTKSFDQPGYLSVSLTNNGCTYNDSVKITLFTDGNDFDDVSFCSSDELPIERSVTVKQNEQILWEDGSNSPNRIICESGMYSYTKSLANCSYSDTFQVLVFENEVNVYPNPGVDQINFTNSNEVFVISIFSSDGKLIVDKPVNGANLNLIIKNLSPGSYILNIMDNGCKSTLTYEKLSLY